MSIISQQVKKICPLFPNEYKICPSFPNKYKNIFIISHKYKKHLHYFPISIKICPLFPNEYKNEKLYNILYRYADQDNPVFIILIDPATLAQFDHQVKII